MIRRAYRDLHRWWLPRTINMRVAGDRWLAHDRLGPTSVPRLYHENRSIFAPTPHAARLRSDGGAHPRGGRIGVATVVAGGRAQALRHVATAEPHRQAVAKRGRLSQHRRR